MSEPDNDRARRITGRLVRPGGDRDAFDAEFWQSLAIKRNDLDEEPPLQRTVGRIIRP